MRAFSRLLLAAIAAVVCAVTSPAATEIYACPWRTVAHPEDPFIQYLGSWAVAQQHTVLHFDKVESAKAQGLGDCTAINRNYELIIDASIRDGAGDGKYRAVVHVVEKMHPQELLSFEALVRKTPAN